MVDITAASGNIPHTAPAHSGEVSLKVYALILLVLAAFGAGVFFIGYPLVICAALAGTAFMLTAIIVVCFSK